MTEEVKTCVLDFIEKELDAIDYLEGTFDPAWYYDTLIKVQRSVLENAFDWSGNPCSPIAASVWKYRKCKSKYQAASREKFIGRLNLLDRLVKIIRNQDCQAV